MCVGTAGRLKAGVSTGQAVRHFGAVCSTKPLIGTPASGNEALGTQSVKPISCRSQVFFTSERQVSLHRGAQRIYMAVCMSGRQCILAQGERSKKRIVQVSSPNFLVPLTRSTLVCDELVLWNGVRLIPRIRFVCARTPSLSLFDS